MSKVILFVPCLVDQLYPEMGVALVKLLRAVGCDPQYRAGITCCGQPAFNAGQLCEARTVARPVVEILTAPESVDLPVVCPSGSCTAMVRKFYAELFHGQPEAGAVNQLAPRVFELSEFLQQHGLLERVRGRYPKKVAFHNSCHSARELELRSQYRGLFENIEGLELIEPSPEPVCCGFGGLFCQKFQGISKGMAVTRLEMLQSCGAEEVASNDPGCIMHLRVMADQIGCTIPIRHSVELLVDALAATA